MSTPLVVSVTNELVAELESLAKKSDAAGEDWVSYADLAGTLANQCDIDYIVDASPATILALLAERAELLRDQKRLEWMMETGCTISAQNGTGMPFVYRVWFPCRSRQFTEWHGTKRAAIDAAMQSEAKP